VNDLALRSRLYAWLGDRTSQPDGNAHDHESLLAASRDLAEVVQEYAAERAADELAWAASAVAHAPGIKHQGKAVDTIRARAATLRTDTDRRNPMSEPRTLADLLTEWNGTARHQTITFEGAADLVKAALADEPEVRRAAAAMTDDELVDALNHWHLRQSEAGR
jgi:hypothetical protein